MIGNETQLELVERLIARGREPHSVMICGERGTGKKTLARELAARLLCEKQDGKSCGVCRHCRLIKDGAHPDLVTAGASETGNYKLDDIRALVSEAYISPSEGRYRIFLIPDLDRSPQTIQPIQNVMLKVIEEPPDSAVIILTARTRELFLDTIISRTLQLTTCEVSPAAALAELDVRGKDRQTAEEAVRRCGGNIGRCLEYCEDEKMRENADIAADICRDLAASDEYRLLTDINRISGKKQGFIQLMEFSQRLTSDAVRVRAGVGTPYLYSQEICRGLALRYSERRLADIYDIFVECAARANSNCLISTLGNYLAARLSEI
jgi:DNA polymerase-3 subunit delta'